MLSPKYPGASAASSSKRNSSVRSRSRIGFQLRRWNGYQLIFQLSVICVLLLGALSGATAPTNAAHSAPLRIKGSYVIAAVCRDGIIVASDSRGVVKDRQGRRLAYYDINQKIFPVGNSLIADTGYASLNDPNISFLSALMLRFARSRGSAGHIDDLPDSYFRYVDDTLPIAGAKSAKIQTLVFAGFQGATPKLCIYKGESSHNVECQSSGYLSSPNEKITAFEQIASLSFQEAARVMQKTIDDYAAAIQPGSVGGPVVIRTMTPSRSRWLSKTPAWPNWSSFADLAKDYNAGRLPYHLMPGINKSQLDALIEESAAWASLRQTPAPASSR